MSTKLLLTSTLVVILLFLSANIIWLPGNLRIDTGDSPGTNNSETPVMAVSGDIIYTAWMDSRNSGHDIYFNRSKDGGKTWLPQASRIDLGDPPGQTPSANPQIACSGSKVYVVWEDNRDNNQEIYFNYSHDYGNNWYPQAIRLATGIEPGEFHLYQPRIAASGEKVYVVWGDGRDGGTNLYFNSSLDGGITWELMNMKVNKSILPNTGYLMNAEIACWEYNVYVTWQEQRDNSNYIYFNRSSDGGLNWDPESIRIDKNDQTAFSTAFKPVIATYSSNVYICWQDFRNGHPGLFFNSSQDSGQTWKTQDTQINSGNKYIDHVYSYHISCNDSSVHMVWQDNRYTKNNVFHNCSIDGGITWQAFDNRLNTGTSPGEHYAEFPVISCSGDTVMAIWQDYRNRYYNGTIDIYSNYSIDGGITWNSEDQKINIRTPGSTHVTDEQQIALSGNKAFAVWKDYRNGLSDIYFNRTTIDIPPGVTILSPSEGDQVKDKVDIRAAMEDDREIRRARFYIDGELKHTIQRPSLYNNKQYKSTNHNTELHYTWNTTGYAYGYHTIKVVVNDSNTQESFDKIKVKLDNPPTVTILQPIENDSLQGIVEITAQAEDDSGIKSLSFFLDGQLLCVDNTPPYSCLLGTINYKNGPHIIKVEALDNSGQKAQAKCNVNIQNIKLQLTGSQQKEQAWFVSRYFNKLELRIYNPGQAQIREYILYRKTGDLGFTEIKRFFPQEVIAEKLTYNDQDINQNQIYTYLIKAMDANNNPIASSNEISL